MSKRKYVVRAWEIEGLDGFLTVLETRDNTEVVIRCSNTSEVHLTQDQWYALTELRYEVHVEKIEQQALTVLSQDTVTLELEGKA